jgi:tetratricopeptide (TPR) repeat protein
MSSIVTTAVETSATARNSLNPHHQNQLKLVHHHHPSSASLSGVREHRHNHIINLKLKQRQHRAALWILNLIINCLLLGHNFCSAFQQQQQQHQSMTNNAMQQRIHHPTQNAVLGNHGITTRSLMKSMQPLFFSPTNQRESSLHQQQQQRTTMTSTTTTASTTTTINNSKNKSSTNSNLDKDSTNQSQPQRSRKQYRRKLPLSPSEKSAAIQRQKRRAAYETMRSASLATTNAPPSIWSFDSFFAAPVLDEKSIQEDLFGTKEREAEMIRERANRKKQLLERRKEREGLLRSEDGEGDGGGVGMGEGESAGAAAAGVGGGSDVSGARAGSDALGSVESAAGQEDADYLSLTPSSKDDDEPRPTIDKVLTRMVQDRMYGLTRSPAGSIQYSSSLMDSGRAVQFRDGIRLGKALAINIDRLCYFAKKDFSHGRLEEAQEFYMKARNMDPTDGRPYLGLSRIAQRRGDYEAARSLLKEGVARSSGGFVVVKGPVGGGGRPVDKGSKNGNRRGNSRDNKNNVDFEGEDESPIGTIPDVGPNPFLLQALGTLEQQMGQLAAAEELYLQAIRSRPSHAAAWVSLAQLRTRELRQGASAGRACYQSAERELQRIGAKPNSFVYTAWASMEYKKGSREDDTKCIQKARELYRKALNVDPHCSAAYLQLGVMESECGNFDEAKMCFEKVLKFDQRNSRVLQAYAVMESRRAPKDEVDSRRVLDLFERALKANPRDAGVYQAYALYVAELGDIDSARKL